MFSYRGATVIADYGHNPDAIEALIQAVETMPARRRSIVISGAGDRRDVDIRNQGVLVGDAFDDVVLYQDQCQRGRADGEVLALLRDGLSHAKRTTVVDEIRGEFLAIDTALSKLSAGDSMSDPGRSGGRGLGVSGAPDRCTLTSVPPLDKDASSLIHWDEGGQAHSALWRSESGVASPKKVQIADDRMTADAAHRLASEGTALLWRGDFQNARQLLQALARRADRKPRKAAASITEAFHFNRQTQAQRARTLGMLLLPCRRTLRDSIAPRT